MENQVFILMLQIRSSLNPISFDRIDSTSIEKDFIQL